MHYSVAVCRVKNISAASIKEHSWKQFFIFIYLNGAIFGSLTASLYNQIKYNKSRWRN